MDRKLVVVCGATGTQGSAVIRSLLEAGSYRIRAISRHPTSAAAQQLAAQEVEVVQATLDDADSLLKAFDGAYAVYGVTPLGDDTEEQQGKNIVDACKANQVSVLIWSSLPSATETSKGKYTNITHFDRKATIEKYIKSAGQTAIIIHTGFFSENLPNFHCIQKAGDGYTVYFPISPGVPVPHTYVGRDLGPSVAAILSGWEKPEIRAVLEAEGPILVCSYRINGTEMADSLSKILGKPTRYTGERSTGTGDLAEMFKYQDDGLLYPDAEIPSPILTKLGLKFHTFDDFVKDVIAPKME